MGTKYEQEKLQQFHNEISDSLREKLNIEIFRETIKIMFTLPLLLVRLPRRGLKRQGWPTAMTKRGLPRPRTT